MNVTTPSAAMFLPSEIIESVVLENLANRHYADKPILQLDLFGHDDQELDRLYERHIQDLGNYFLYG
jgi:hypothetical protein